MLPLPELGGSRPRGPSFLHVGPRLQSPTCTPKDLLASGPPALAAHTEMEQQVSSAHPDRGRPQGFAARLGVGGKDEGVEKDKLPDIKTGDIVSNIVLAVFGVGGACLPGGSLCEGCKCLIAESHP